MRAMPSPISRTRPTARASTAERNCSISCRRTETISSALNLITAFHTDLLPEIFQTAANAAVVQPTFRLHDKTAQKVGIDACAEDRFLAERFSQIFAQALQVLLIQRDRRLDGN